MARRRAGSSNVRPISRPSDTLGELGDFNVRRNLTPLFGWYPGPTAQVEIVEQASDANKPDSHKSYKSYSVSPLRPAIRQPMKDIELAPRDRDNIRTKLGDVKNLLNEGDQLRSAVSNRSLTLAKKAELKTNENNTTSALTVLGERLKTRLLPPDLREFLNRDQSVFLEIGVPEELHDWPVELMYDTRGFYCLRHFVGRYVVSTTRATPPPRSRYDEQREAPNVLLIAVSDPKQAGYRGLPRVSDEANKIEELVRSIAGTNITVLKDAGARDEDITTELAKEGVYDIIHFCGHAHFDDGPGNVNSKLITYKSSLSMFEVSEYFAMAKPILCFINGCESVLGSDKANRFNLYGLGKAVLNTGAYLLGTRSRIADKGAADFAVEFYTKLLRERRSLGESVMSARNVCKDKSAGTFGWASYVFYGDPRFGFPKT